MNVLNFLEKTSTKYPDKICVDDGKKTLTFAELNHKAKCIGAILQDKIAIRKPIVILAEKSADVLATMMGVVYAGDYYVMVDPSQPASRLQGILQVLGAELVITNAEGEKLLAEAGYQHVVEMLENLTGKNLTVATNDIVIENQHSKEQKQSSVNSDSNRVAKRNISTAVVLNTTHLRLNELTPQDILYCLFTSGSTGTPKAIAVSHQCVMDFIPHFAKEFDFTAEDIIGNQAPFDFDVSVKDIYTSFYTGAKMILIPREYFSTPPLLLDLICDKEVTNLTWAVSALTMISALKGFKYRVPDKIKRVMFSGEVMPDKQLKIWQEAIPDAQFVNLYGPTEITCNCTFYKIQGKWHENDQDKLPIGQAFEGRRVFLLDENDKVIEPQNPFYQSGEICVTGESVALGYINNPSETAKRFVFYDFEKQQVVDAANVSASYTYRTGDLGYWGADGLLYFNGRKDFQIKHMGHRIELEEIEAAFQKISGVDKCCCFMDEKRNRLVGFYMGDAMEDEMKEQLKISLPVYMVPHTIRKLEALPLTKNGKTDRAKLKQMYQEKQI